MAPSRSYFLCYNNIYYGREGIKDKSKTKIFYYLNCGDYVGVNYRKLCGDCDKW